MKLNKNFQVDVSGCTPEEIKEMAEFSAGELGCEVDYDAIDLSDEFKFLWCDIEVLVGSYQYDAKSLIPVKDFRALMNDKKESSECKNHLGHSVSSSALEKQNAAQKALDEVHCCEGVSKRIHDRTMNEPVEFFDIDGNSIEECLEVPMDIAAKMSKEKQFLENYDKHQAQMEEEYTGSSVSYYKVKVEKPTTIAEPYEAECNDIIEALNMNYAEGNVFKAIWRKCAARLGKSKKGYTDGLYDSEKVVFFGGRMVEQEKHKDV